MRRNRATRPTSPRYASSAHAGRATASLFDPSLIGRSERDAIQRGSVVVKDLAGDVAPHRTQVLVDHLQRMRPRRVAVREVAAPHEGVGAESFGGLGTQ